MNIVKLQNDLKDLSDQQLVDTMQTGSAPQYLVLAELQRRKKMRDEAATQAPQGDSTVADEIMGGIAAIPMGSMDMASGGLVSFAKGGEAKGKKNSAEMRREWLGKYESWLRGGQKGDAPAMPEYYEPGLSDYATALPGGQTLVRMGVLDPADFGIPKYEREYDAAIQALSTASPEEISSFLAQQKNQIGEPGSIEREMRASGMYDRLMENALRRSDSNVKGYAAGGYAKGEAEACWTNPETGEKMCPSSKPDVRKPTVKKMQQGGTTGGDGVLRLLPEDPVADAYAYLQSRGAEIPADMSEQGIIDYANRVRALDENEIKGAGMRVPAEAAGDRVPAEPVPAITPSSAPYGAPRVDYGSGGRGEVMPETSIDAAPTMPMGGGEYTPGFSPVAPVQDGLPGLLAPEGPAPGQAPEGAPAQKAVPFLAQVAEAIMPSAQAADLGAPVDADLSEQERRMALQPRQPAFTGDPELITAQEQFQEQTQAAQTQEEREAAARRFTEEVQGVQAERKAEAEKGRTVVPYPGSAGVTGQTDAQRQASADQQQAFSDWLAAQKSADPETRDDLLELYRELRSEREEGKKGAKGRGFNEALMRAGLAMMASKNPDFLGALGEGGLEGLKAYGEAQKTAASEQELALKEAADLLAAREGSLYKGLTGQSSVITGIQKEIERLSDPLVEPPAGMTQQAFDIMRQKRIAALEARLSQILQVGAMSNPYGLSPTTAAKLGGISR